ncbi:MAG: ROK family protein [Clostridia bacterium]|nr:ROK family protein [Clostridia bacterium]
MEKTSQQHIKWENTRSVFRAIAAAEEGGVSRAQIAEQTGLSLMTIGKIADELDALGIVAQQKDERITAGRTARLISCVPDWHILVLDLTAVNFRLFILDLSLRVLDEITYPYDEMMFCDENLVMFFKNISMYRRTKIDIQFCIGAAVLLPGAYDAAADRIYGCRLPAFAPLRPKAVLHHLIPAPQIIYIEDVRAAAMSARLQGIEQKEDGSTLWLSLDHPVSGALLVDGRPLLGANNCAGRFGEVTVGTRFNLNEAMLSLTDQTERAAALAIALYNLIAVFDPAQILLESRIQVLDDEFMASVQARLQQMNHDRMLPLPQIRTAETELSAAVRGIAQAICETWLRRKCIKKTN